MKQIFVHHTENKYRSLVAFNKGLIVSRCDGVKLLCHCCTVARYLFYDAWNILDASTAALAMLALIFRIIGQQGATESESVVGENALNIAQWCFLFSAPFLFSRVLFLSQIDDTLGPMTQVHDTMLVRRERESQPICVEGGAIGLKR